MQSYYGNLIDDKTYRYPICFYNEIMFLLFLLYYKYDVSMFNSKFVLLSKLRNSDDDVLLNFHTFYTCTCTYMRSKDEVATDSYFASNHVYSELLIISTLKYIEIFQII